jgi:FAD/FMN-containing dehydrogenase
VVDAGICADLRTMNRVDVDPDQRIARVAGAAKWGAIDASTQEHGLAVTGGRMSDTGIGGLALGSGSGWLERKFGLTCDNLVKAEVVTADGRQVIASEDENADLYWGLRGGGGNFGVVTAFHLRLHPVGPILLAGQLMYPAPMAGDLLRFYRDFIVSAPDEVCGGIAFITAPPEEFVPEPVRGQPVVGVIVVYAGDPDEGEEAFGPLREFGPPGLDMVDRMPYVAVQQMIDGFNPKGLLNYWNADFYAELPDEAIDVFVGYATKPVSPFSQMLVLPGGGAIGRVPEDATAFGQRDAQWNLHYLSLWDDPAETDRNIAYTREFSGSMKPWATGRAYLNFLGDKGLQRVEAAYGPEKFARLQALKDKWDPTNLFRHNQNIPPSS